MVTCFTQNTANSTLYKPFQSKVVGPKQSVSLQSLESNVDQLKITSQFIVTPCISKYVKR